MGPGMLSQLPTLLKSQQSKQDSDSLVGVGSHLSFTFKDDLTITIEKVLQDVNMYLSKCQLQLQ